MKHNNISSIPPNGNPTSLIVVGMRDAEIDFQWDIGSTDHEGHRIYISTNGSNYTEDGFVLGNINTYTATGLVAGVLYYFYVVAYIGNGESSPTNIYDTRFKITVDTTKAGSASNTFILKNYTSGTYNYYIDWGEGSEEHITTAGNHTHIYATPGTYQIKIRGTMPRIYVNNGGDYRKIISIDNWGNILWSSFEGAFYSCINMTSNAIDVPNLSHVTSMRNMFSNCYLFNSPINIWDVSLVTTMRAMFIGCKEFNQPLDMWDVSNVTDMNNMFYYASKFNQSLESWDISKVSDMLAMLQDTALSTSNYDSILIAWANLSVTSSVKFGANPTKYSAGAAKDARDHLTNIHSWTITDGGQI